MILILGSAVEGGIPGPSHGNTAEPSQEQGESYV